jgi:hypothetical protein
MPRSRTAALRVGLVLAAMTALLAAQAGAVSADSSAALLSPEWHVHDGLTGLGPQHKAVGFFPTILGLSTTDYALDPATCPNATDKAFLPSYGNGASSVLRAGACFTSSAVINVRTVPYGTAGPDGWASLYPTDGSVPGGPWVTYYQVTAR